MRILILEDDLVLADILSEHLEEKGYEIVVFEDGESALRAIESQKFDLLVLDINVPKKSGPEVLKSLRSYHNTTPAIIITAYQDTAHLKLGFECGCDDYIKKPFDLEEFDMRIENLCKRFAIESEKSIHLGEDMALIPSKNTLHVKDKTYTLAHKECEILVYLCAHPKRLISADELMQNLWSYDTMPTEATIRVYIKNLRNLIGKEKIQTIRGSGYSFE
ncbi:MAG: response regulator transcription factor [Sulfurospirillaceae bacterium]|nr:response regulator transcription factor [Sulfurospirillaceae bacterium]MDD2826702.1 response regulator transcription factor [Sulfurospirillaceae bacterium]